MLLHKPLSSSALKFLPFFALLASIGAILVSTICSMRKITHGKEKKLAETGRSMARHGRVTRLMMPPLRRVAGTVPAKNCSCVHCGCSQFHKLLIKLYC